ncbi:trehalose synthase [Corynebacterium aquatimens]|uniref:trehalose synthase n=1 Tax=Corynebacterium TaxID=1716 RepID=UPI001F31AD85|nr:MULTISPECIES: trehalose synthase [Corynebacterium]QYH19373.1 trehalose synthase [Corynebacterium aquatimens]UIZ91716.1 trehalose synthase [Corynebacterium sp. CNCTC7651]
MIDITGERFFGSKAAAVGGTSVANEAPLGGYTWQLIEVELQRGTEVYQVLVEGDTDVLNTDAGATAYVAHAHELGEVHGTLTTGPATPLGAEQSNTSLVVGDTIFKVFRKLEGGLNPDVELLSRIDNPHIAAVHGYVTRGDQTLAMQQARIDGTDGYQLATSEGLTVESATSLGVAIRSVHDSLASAFGTEEVDADGVRAELHARLDRNIERAAVLKDYEAGLRTLIDGAFTHPTVTVQRVHGDLHLGQTLKTADTWYLIDFEGEPARPLEERRRPDSPLRDVAGMVRSFGYASAPQEQVDALLAGYGDVEKQMLNAYIADKAAYEVAYEANNRPDWIDIPLRAVKDLTDPNR